MPQDDFQARLDALVGEPVGSPEARPGPDPVNQPMIRHWAAAFEDANPVYTDPDAAARVARSAQIVAPPVMLQTWTFPTPIITGMAERGGSPVESTGASPLDVLDEAGFIATLASNSEFEIERYLHLGEIVSAPDGDGVDLRGEADPHRPGPLRHLGHHLHRRRRRGRRPPAVPHPEVQAGRRPREHPPRPVDVARHPVLLGRPEGAPAPHPALHRRAARCATRPGRCARRATRSGGTRSRPSGRGTVHSFVMPQHPQFPFFEDPYIVALVELEEGTRLVSNLCDVGTGGRVHRHAGRGLLRRVRRRPGAAPVPPGGWRDDAAVAATSSPSLAIDDDRHPDRRRRHRDPRLHAGAPRPRLRQQPGRAGHLHEHHLDQRLLHAGTSPTGPVPTRCCKRLAIRLGVPVFPGSTLTFTGTSPTCGQAGDEVLVDVEFRASNDLGDHATGTATLVAARPARHEPPAQPAGPPSPASARRSSRRSRAAPSSSSPARRSRPRSTTPASPRPTSTASSPSRSTTTRRWRSAATSASTRCGCSAASPTAAARRRPPCCRRRWPSPPASPTSSSSTGPSTSGPGMRFGSVGGELTTMPPWLSWYAPFGLLTPASWVAVHARRYMHDVRRDQRGLRPHRRGRPHARGDQPRRLVLRATDHDRGPPGVALGRRAGAPPPRLLPGERRRRRARRHLAPSGPATCASRRR